MKQIRYIRDSNRMQRVELRSLCENGWIEYLGWDKDGRSAGSTKFWNLQSRSRRGGGEAPQAIEGVWTWIE